MIGPLSIPKKSAPRQSTVVAASCNRPNLRTRYALLAKRSAGSRTTKSWFGKNCISHQRLGYFSQTDLASNKICRPRGNRDEANSDVQRDHRGSFGSDQAEPSRWSSSWPCWHRSCKLQKRIISRFGGSLPTFPDEEAPTSAGLPYRSAVRQSPLLCPSAVRCGDPGV